MASELESDLQDTAVWGSKWLVDFSAGKAQLVSFDQSTNSTAFEVKMNASVFEEKSSFKMLEVVFSSKLNSGSYIGSATTASKKIGALIISIQFFSPEVAFYLRLLHKILTYCF